MWTTNSYGCHRVMVLSPLNLHGNRSDVDPPRLVLPNKWLWRRPLPMKISILAYRALKLKNKNKLPFDASLQRLGVSLCSKCNCCQTPASESLTHVFLSGDKAAACCAGIISLTSVRFQLINHPSAICMLPSLVRHPPKMSTAASALSKLT